MQQGEIRAGTACYACVCLSVTLNLLYNYDIQVIDIVSVIIIIGMLSILNDFRKVFPEEKVEQIKC